MNIEAIKAFVKEILGGDFRLILGFRFANGYKVSYATHPMEESDLMTIAGVEFLKFEHRDVYRDSAFSYLEIEEIVQIYTLPSLDSKIKVNDVME